MEHDLSLEPAPVVSECLLVLVAGGAVPKRDVDFSLQVLRDLEASPDWVVLHAIHLTSSEEDRARYAHLQLLRDAGLVQELGSRYGGSWRITNDGHDFLAYTREPKRWEAIKAMAVAAGGATLREMLAIAQNMATDALKAAGYWPS